MPRRKRKHIPCEQRLAAALVCLLPQAERDYLRRARQSGTGNFTAQRVISLFTFDHIHLHAWSGGDDWSNLDPRRRGLELKAKDAADTSRAAKAVRIDEKWVPFTRAMAKGTKPRKRKAVWPKRKIRRRK